MARRKKEPMEPAEPNEAPPPPQHNSAARADTLRKAMRELDRIEGDIAVLREEAKSLKNTLIKSDLGMKLADFAVFRRLHQLEGDARDELADVIREGFLALGIGEQSSFLTALEVL